ncbi:MAG: glycosyltransferase, partial [bacterium]
IGLATNPSRAAQMGQSARTMLEAEFTRAHAFARWRQVLDSLLKRVEGPRSGSLARINAPVTIPGNSTPVC